MLPILKIYEISQNGVHAPDSRSSGNAMNTEVIRPIPGCCTTACLPQCGYQTESATYVLRLRLVNRSFEIHDIARLTRQILSLSLIFTSLSRTIKREEPHRFFEIPKLSSTQTSAATTGLQHVAFEYASLDNLLGTYIRLKELGILPTWAADHGLAMSFYYEDPDKNIVELTINNYGEAWTATEYLKTAASAMPVQVDPEKMIPAREAGASPWEIHKRAVAGEFAPAEPFNPGSRF